MIKSLIPYILMFCFLWFMPDLFMFSKNVSNYIYKEATVRPFSRVEVKVVKKLPYLPLKYGVLAPGQKNLRVEFMDTTKNYAVSAAINDDGVALFESLPNSTYTLRVGGEVELSPTEIADYGALGQSVFSESEVISTSIETVTISSDVFLAPVIK